jgi:hypothetical protein
VLSEDLGIAITLRDFFMEWEEDDPGYWINPLEFACVKGTSRMLVVTCHYVMEKAAKKSAEPVFRLDPTSIEFHLLESGSMNLRDVPV